MYMHADRRTYKHVHRVQSPSQYLPKPCIPTA